MDEPAIEAVALERRFGETRALRRLSFAVAPGTLYGLIGPDGAGKTTAIRALAGLIDLDGGSARILGRDSQAGGAELRSSLGLMPQQYSLYRDLSVAENLRFFGRIYCLPRAVYRQRADQLLALTRLGRFADRRADALSGGMYKKLALACALLHRPEVLLLDEPTNGVDPVSRRELWDLLYRFAADGMTILLSTPYMDEAERCHHVGLIDGGRLLLAGEPRQLLADFDHQAFEVDGGDRASVDALLRTRSEVKAQSPAGARLRIVLVPGSEPAVARALLPLGATLRRTQPDFEDLFLVRTAEEAAA